MVLLDRFAKKVHAWTNMTVDGVNFTDPSEGTFVSANMRPEYENPGSKQWGAKFIDDIAWIYNNVTSRYWEKCGFSGTFDQDGGAHDEIYYDSARDYDGKYVFFCDELTNFTDVVQLTTSYQALFGNHTAIWEIKALGGGGFQIHNKFGTPKSLICYYSVHRWVNEDS